MATTWYKNPKDENHLNNRHENLKAYDIIRHYFVALRYHIAALMISLYGVINLLCFLHSESKKGWRSVQSYRYS
jgi:hypothetical protein